MYVCDDKERIIVACMVSQYELNTKIMGCFGMLRPRMNANLWDLVLTHLVNETPVARNRLLPWKYVTLHKRLHMWFIELQVWEILIKISTWDARNDH